MKTKIVLAATALFMATLSSFALAQNAQEAAATPPAAPAVAPAPAAVAAPTPAASEPTAAEALTGAIREKALAFQRRACGEQKETATVEINFQYAKDDLTNLSKEIEEKVANVKSEATKAGATAVEMAEMNYNVNSRNVGYREDESNGKYRISGNMRFTVTPADKAAVLLQSLSTQKEYRVNLNYRMNAGICRGMMQ